MNPSRIYRLLRLITMLQNGKSYTTDELADDLEVSRRTVFRDLNMLEMAHVPYHYDPEKGGYRIHRRFFLPPVNLTIPEALALLLLVGGLRGSKKIPLLSHAAQAAMKLKSALPEPIREEVDRMLDHVSVSLGAISDHQGMDGMFHSLADAVAQKKITRLHYESLYDKKTISCKIYPLRLVFMSRGWYLLAYSVKHRQVRTFKFLRIKKLFVSDQTFETPTHVEIEKHFGDAWQMIPEGTIYDIHLRFSAKVGHNVAEVQWHASQKASLNEDGTLDFCVRVDGLEEISWWILGYGDQVEVISPAALRKRIADTANSMHRKYQEGNA